MWCFGWETQDLEFSPCDKNVDDGKESVQNENFKKEKILFSCLNGLRCFINSGADCVLSIFGCWKYFSSSKLVFCSFSLDIRDLIKLG